MTPVQVLFLPVFPRTHLHFIAFFFFSPIPTNSLLSDIPEIVGEAAFNTLTSAPPGNAAAGGGTAPAEPR